MSQLQENYNNELEKLQNIFDEEKEKFYSKEKEVSATSHCFNLTFFTNMLLARFQRVYLFQQTAVIEKLVQSQLENKPDNEQSLPDTLQTLQTTISALQEKILNYEKLNEEIQTKHRYARCLHSCLYFVRNTVVIDFYWMLYSEQEAKHAATIASLKEDYEIELSHWKSKLDLDTKNLQSV